MLIQKRIQSILIILYAGSVIISFYFTDIKYRSLNFQQRDYPFYLQFASKLLDPNIAKSYTLNPDGDNWLYFNGTEGINNFNQAIHFEPIKYFYAVLYHFSNTPLTLFLFASLIMFLPLLYAAFAIPMGTKQQLFAVLSIAVLYIAYPTTLIMPSYDLRPYIFLAPFFLLSLMSISFSRPLWEILIWFNALFFTREEALILGAVLILYASVKIKETSLRHKIVLSLSIAFIIWGIAIISFMIWSGYPTLIFELPAKILNRINGLRVQKLVLFGAAILVIFAFFAAAVISWTRLRRKAYFPRLLEIISFGILFFPLVYQFYRNETTGILSPSIRWMTQVLLDPQEHLNFIAFLGFGMIALFPFEGNYSKGKVVLAGTSLLVIIFLSINVFAPQGMLGLFKNYQAQIRSAEDVWSVRKSTDKYQSWILVDYSTYQAFYDYQHVIVYNRLPWQVVAGDIRYYPSNKPIVQELVNDQMEYIVVSEDSKGVINDFLSNSGLSSLNLFENDKFEGLQITGR